MTEELRNEVIRLMTLNSPFHASLAANKLLAIKTNDKEQMAELLELVDRWLSTFRSILQTKHQVEDAVVPIIEALYRDLKGTADNPEDDFLAPLMAEAKGESDRIRPSRVPQPGPLDRIAFPQTEDELRHSIIAWQSDRDNGRRQPLFWFGREPFWGYGLRERYLARSIERRWVSTRRWEPDLAIVEDILLVNCFFQTRLTTVSRNFKAAAAEFLTRKYTVHDCRLAGRRAVRKLEREGLLTRIKPQTWVLTQKGHAAVKEIIAIWGYVDKPAEG